MKLISVVSNHIKKYPRVGTMIVVVAGISIVVIDGKLAHTWWTKPCAPPIGYVPITQYDAKMLMASTLSVYVPIMLCKGLTLHISVL